MGQQVHCLVEQGLVSLSEPLRTNRRFGANQVQN
jgi:hypothetical protein